MHPLRKRWLQQSLARTAVIIVVGTLIVWSMIWSEFSPQILFQSGPRFTEFFTRLIPPDWSVAHLVIKSTAETLMITLAGTAIAVFISLPLGFLAAANVTPPWIAQPVRLLCGLMRSIPLLIVALLFVAAVGLGPFPGALAIAFHSTGMLAKFYAEEFETADRGIINAVAGTGASWPQILRFGLIPQCLPQVITFTVFRFEMNFRDAAVLGLVGAGGIGYYIQLYVRGFQYEKVGVLLLVIVLIVSFLDQLTYWVRRWVR